jgi:hypothetical protein
MNGVLAALAIATVLGFRHALEPDHLAAVSTLVAERRTTRAGATQGAWWGAGHALSLLFLGIALLALRLRLWQRAGAWLELAVSTMLLLLGVRSIAIAIRSARATFLPAHVHAGVPAHRESVRPHVHFGRFTLARRPLLVGVIHGLAGSGAVSTLALASMPSAALGMLYVVAFGAGSILGMTAIAGAAGVPLRRLATCVPARVGFGIAAGALSATIGVWNALEPIRALR